MLWPKTKCVISMGDSNADKVRIFFKTHYFEFRLERNVVFLYFLKHEMTLSSVGQTFLFLHREIW